MARNAIIFIMVYHLPIVAASLGGGLLRELNRVLLITF